MTFGQYFAEKRVEHEMTLREMAKKLGVSAPYLSDVEKGRRKPLSFDKLEAAAAMLNLTDDEKTELLNLAGKDRDEIAPDLPEYIMNNSYVTYALREARDNGASEQDWLRFVEELKQRQTKE